MFINLDETDLLAGKEMLNLAKKSGIKTLLFALPNYEESLDLLLSVILKINN